MKDSTSYKAASNLTVLLVGDQKTGKTCIAMGFDRPWFLDVDRNLDSAARMVEGKKTFYFDNPTLNDDGSRVEDDKVYPRAMDMLRIAAVDPKIGTLVIDSLSTLSNYMCTHIISECSRMEGKKLESLRIQDYGRVLAMLNKLIAFLRATQKTVIICCHQTYDKNELDGALYYTLAIPGQSKFNFGAYCSDVWGVTASMSGGGKVKYEIHTRPSGRHVALGTSMRTMPSVIDITDKDPIQIGALIAPYLSAGQKLTQTAAPATPALVPSGSR